MQKIKLLVVMMLVGHACVIVAGPLCSKKFRNQLENSVDVVHLVDIDAEHSDLVAFTHKHIAQQQIQAERPESRRQDFLWKKEKPYSHCRTNQKILYRHLCEDVLGIIREYMGIDAPMKECQDFYSPLQYAVNCRDGDKVQILLALGANINLTPARCERTPLYITIKKYQYASHVESRQKIYEAKSYAIFRYLLTKGADYNKSNEKKELDALCEGGETPLHAAADSRNTMPLLQDLLQLPNINLHAKDRWGSTALDCARRSAMSDLNINYRKHFYRVCELLEQAGASISVILSPMPSDEVMRYENECSIARMERESREWGW